jgi:hypothetical protein
MPKENWHHPTIARSVDKEFVSQAKENWQGGIDEWILEGQWLDTRNDIVAWLRVKYWKTYQRRYKESLIPLDQPAREKSSGGVGASEADAQGSQSARGRESWRDVVLGKQPDDPK